MIIIVMGVSGSGKTTVGSVLADALACGYLEGDSLHTEANIAAMTAGVPLTDADRAPWLASIHDRIVEAWQRGSSLVVGCSALTESYRATLADGVPVIWVYLKGPPDLIQARLEDRTGHFMAAGMLGGQVEILEEPSDAIVIDITPPPHVIVEQILVNLSGRADVRVSDSLQDLSDAAAREVATVINAVVAENGRCSVVLSGGITPRGLHRALATRYHDAIPWPDVHVFWSDERYVSPDDPRSNYGMARETLLDHVPCPLDNIHAMPTGFDDPSAAAHEYERVLEVYFAGARPSFDLAILGIGEDGHTASLFPGSSSLHEQERWVLAVEAAAEPPTRLTLTMPVLASSARSWFLVDGSSKAPAVARALSGSATTDVCPAAAIQRSRGEVIWWLDRAAGRAARRGRT